MQQSPYWTPHRRVEAYRVFHPLLLVPYSLKCLEPTGGFRGQTRHVIDGLIRFGLREGRNGRASIGSLDGCQRGKRYVQFVVYRTFEENLEAGHVGSDDTEVHVDCGPIVRRL
jgi:hypothetical protein